jgi:LPS export ABC transporter protein LptC
VVIVRNRKLGLVASLVALVGTAACQGDRSTPVASEFAQGIDAPVVFGMTSFITVDGVREGRVEADTAYTFQDSTKVDLRVMNVVFYDESGRERATVSGRSGEWNQDTNRMIARGDVVLRVHTDSSRIESAEIHYDPENDRIWSDSATVRTLADGTVTRGTAFESDIEFTNVRVLNIRGGAGPIF